MNVRDLMTSVVITVRPQTPLKEVAAILARCGISGVPVVDEGGRVLGVVSEADILFKERGPSHRQGILGWLDQARGKDDQLKRGAQTAAQAMTAPREDDRAWAAGLGGGRADVGRWRRPPSGRRRRERAGRDRHPRRPRSRIRAFGRREIEREIREKVLERALVLETPATVRVEVDQGKVTLSGSLRRRSDAELLPTLAAKVPGVVQVGSSIDWQEDNQKRDPRPLALVTREE